MNTSKLKYFKVLENKRSQRVMVKCQIKSTDQRY